MNISNGKILNTENKSNFKEGHNIFNKLSNTDYKQVLGLLKHCILATDLAMFFPNKARLSRIVEQGSFSWSNTDHRMLLQAITMTGSDLSASAKPWDIQVETVRVIFEEFYQQGDAERYIPGVSSFLVQSVLFIGKLADILFL